jgi:hypothetical protein
MSHACTRGPALSAPAQRRMADSFSLACHRYDLLIGINIRDAAGDHVDAMDYSAVGIVAIDDGRWSVHGGAKCYVA